MTEMVLSSSMVVNVLSLLVRSPGVYFNDKVDKNGKVGYDQQLSLTVGHGLSFKQIRKDIAYHSWSTVHVRFHSQRLCKRLTR